MKVRRIASDEVWSHKTLYQRKIINQAWEEHKRVDDPNTETRNISLFLPRLVQFFLIFHFNHTSDFFFLCTSFFCCGSLLATYPDNHKSFSRLLRLETIHFHSLKFIYIFFFSSVSAVTPSILFLYSAIAFSFIIF